MHAWQGARRQCSLHKEGMSFRTSTHTLCGLCVCTPVCVFTCVSGTLDLYVKKRREENRAEQNKTEKKEVEQNKTEIPLPRGLCYPRIASLICASGHRQFAPPVATERKKLGRRGWHCKRHYLRHHVPCEVCQDGYVAGTGR